MPTDAPIIRRRRDTDMAEISRIYAHHVLHGASSWELEPPDADELLRRAKAIEEAGYPYLIAEDDNLIAGYAYASAYRPRPAYRYTVEHSIYVDDQRRRGGIGSALLEALIAECTQLGFRQMIGIVGDSQNVQSIAFHEKLGFERVGTVKSIGFKFGRWMDQVLLQRPLASGSKTLPDENS